MASTVLVVSRQQKANLLIVHLLSSRPSIPPVPSWDRATGEFAPLLESSQYCASASPGGGGTFNYNTSTWVPGTYELRVRTIVYYGNDGVESNGTAPGGSERFCISPPYTSESVFP